MIIIVVCCNKTIHTHTHTLYTHMKCYWTMEEQEQQPHTTTNTDKISVVW